MDGMGGNLYFRSLSLSVWETKMGLRNALKVSRGNVVGRGRRWSRGHFRDLKTQFCSKLISKVQGGCTEFIAGFLHQIAYKNNCRYREAVLQ